MVQTKAAAPTTKTPVGAALPEEACDGVTVDMPAFCDRLCFTREKAQADMSDDWRTMIDGLLEQRQVAGLFLLPRDSNSAAL